MIYINKSLDLLYLITFKDGVYYVNCKGLEERELERKIYKKNTTPQRFSLLYVVIIERFVATTTAVELSWELKIVRPLITYLNYISIMYVPCVIDTVLYFSKLHNMYI